MVFYRDLMAFMHGILIHVEASSQVRLGVVP